MNPKEQLKEIHTKVLNGECDNLLADIEELAILIHRGVLIRKESTSEDTNL